MTAYAALSNTLIGRTNRELSGLEARPGRRAPADSL